MKKALLYEKLANLQVRCDVCHHHCVIMDGHRGLCGVRENQDGTLYALNYGKTISAALDPIEKKPLYHFFPHTTIYSFATVGCNLRCSWCQNWEISQASKPQKPMIGDIMSPEEHVEWAQRYGCPSIAYTYSEPTIFLEYAWDTMKIAKEQGLKNVWVTNGYMSGAALELILPYLDAANVDLKCSDDDISMKYTGGKLMPVIDNIRTMLEHKVHVEITTLVIPGVNDTQEQLQTIVDLIVKNFGVDVPWHISRFFPAWKMKTTAITPLRTLEIARDLGLKAGIKTIHLGNV